MPIPLLVVIDTSDPQIDSKLKAAGFVPTYALEPSARAEAIAAGGDTIRAVLTHGSSGFTAAEMAQLPKIEIICCLGAGHENIDHAAARARGIVMTHGPGTNDTTVADHAMALILSVVRDVAALDATVKTTGWPKDRITRPMVTGKRLGILGLGTIGKQIAKRGAGGFDMEIGYCNRRPVEGSPYRYFATPVELADWADIFVIAAPGGGATRHLVNRDVLKALGSHGYLVNIARGSIIDTEALIEALRDGVIAGAGLDVVDGEPVVPAELLAQPTLTITPHTAGRSPESVNAMVGLVIRNLSAHFAGEPVITPVRH